MKAAFSVCPFVPIRSLCNSCNTPGIVGDKPIETLGEVGKAALTSGTSAVLKQAASAAGLSGTSTATTPAASATTAPVCADGACAVKQAFPAQDTKDRQVATHLLQKENLAFCLTYPYTLLSC